MASWATPRFEGDDGYGIPIVVEDKKKKSKKHAMASFKTSEEIYTFLEDIWKEVWTQQEEDEKEAKEQAIAREKAEKEEIARLEQEKREAEELKIKQAKEAEERRILEQKKKEEARIKAEEERARVAAEREKKIQAAKEKADLKAKEAAEARERAKEQQEQLAEEEAEAKRLAEEEREEARLRAQEEEDERAMMNSHATASDIDDMSVNMDQIVDGGDAKPTEVVSNDPGPTADIISSADAPAVSNTLERQDEKEAEQKSDVVNIGITVVKEAASSDNEDENEESLQEDDGLTDEERIEKKALEAATFIFNRANELHDDGKYLQAIPLYEEALYTRELYIHSPEDTRIIELVSMMGQNYSKLRDFKKADHFYQLGSDYTIAKYNYFSAEAVESMQPLIKNYHAMGQIGEAHKLIQECVDIRVQIHGEDDPETAIMYQLMSSSLLTMGRFQDAKYNSDRAYAILYKAYGMKT